MHFLKLTPMAKLLPIIILVKSLRLSTVVDGLTQMHLIDALNLVEEMNEYGEIDLDDYGLDSNLIKILKKNLDNEYFVMTSECVINTKSNLLQALRYALEINDEVYGNTIIDEIEKEWKIS
jgi:hypothetical protein